MSGGDLATCILAAADAVDSARDELGRLDAVAGDGDHGLTMAIAARAVRQSIAQSPGAAPADLIVKVASAMGSVGGAIGPIYATALLRIAAITRGRAAADGPVTVVELRACADAASTAVSALGHAKPGDKTILDALVPLAESLLASEKDGSQVGAALVRASDAARAGAEGTAGMIASIGRAARLGEQSRGTADAGATSFAIVVAAAVAAYLAGHGAGLGEGGA
jgi:dihydroxyacetone kinase